MCAYTCVGGKGGKGLGKGGAKRHRKILRSVVQAQIMYALLTNGNRDNIQGITKPAIRRLARRGGVKRISASMFISPSPLHASSHPIKWSMKRLVVYLRPSLRVSSEMLLHTLNTRNERLLLHLMWSMPWNDKGVLSTGLVAKLVNLRTFIIKTTSYSPGYHGNGTDALQYMERFWWNDWMDELGRGFSSKL